MSKLSRNVLKEIERRRLQPRSAAYFLAKRSVFWLLAAGSVALGGMSIAFGLFYFTDLLETHGRQFDEMAFDDLAPGIPLATVLAFSLLSASAYYSFSRTPRGYRYRTRSIVASVAAASLLLGLLFHWLGAGSALNSLLTRMIPAYAEYTHIPYEEWSHPELGLLGGTVLSEREGESIRLRDFHGREWLVDTSGATIGLEGSLLDEGDVAIRGQQTGPASFRALAIVPFD